MRELREAHPTYRSLRQFADALSKSPSWVSKVERNLEKPGQQTLMEIARVLNADSQELFDLAELLEPDVEKEITGRLAEVSGLLRTIKNLSPDQITELEEQAKRMSGEKDMDQ